MLSGSSSKTDAEALLELCMRHSAAALDGIEKLLQLALDEDDSMRRTFVLQQTLARVGSVAKTLRASCAPVPQAPSSSHEGAG